MIFRLKSYVNYLWQSKNQYGVHSPFVYDFLTLGLRKKPEQSLQRAKDYRKQLLSDSSLLQIKDFGAGSKKLAQKTRRVNDIAKVAGISSAQGLLLHKTLTYFKPEEILEVGTSIGLSTAIMSASLPQAQITSLEGCPNTALYAQQSLEENGFGNVELKVGPFEETLTKALHGRQYGLIYLDGNHQKEATLKYFDLCLPHLKPEGIIILDDINWSQGMREAWEEIKAKPELRLSMENFHWGMCFFQDDRARENFVLRF